MKRRAQLFLIAGAVLLSVAGGQALEAQARESGTVANRVRPGKDLFNRSCAVCHGRAGGGRIGPALDGNHNLARSDYVTAIILRGKDGMPPFADRLSETEIMAVASYIRGAWGNDFLAPDPEVREDEVRDDRAREEGVDDEQHPEAAGGVLVAQWWRGADDASDLFERICARCHGEDGGGGFGPPLVRNDNLSNAQYVAGKILHGQGGMPAFDGLLTAQQVTQLATFVRSAFGNDLGAVDQQMVRSLQSTPLIPGELQVTVFPADARLTIVGPDRFVHFVANSPARDGPVNLGNLLPGTYVVTGTSDGYRPRVAEVRVLPLQVSRLILDLGSSPPGSAAVAAEAPGDEAAGVRTAMVAAESSARSVEVGGVLYRRSCAMCHGPEGGGGIGPPLAGNGTLQNLQFVLDRILNGTSVMPSFADRLTPAQISVIATYELNSWGNRFGPVMPDQVSSRQTSEDTPEVAPPDRLASGAEIYEEYCAACHGGLGFGAMGPPLQDNEVLADLPYTVSRIVMGGGGMPSFHGVLSTAQLAEVASFIREAWGNDFGPVGISRVQNYHGRPTNSGP